MTTQTERVELIQLPPDTIYQSIHPLQPEVHYHKNPIFESVHHTEDVPRASEVDAVVNRETITSVIDLNTALDKEIVPHIIEVERETRAIEPTKMFKSGVSEQGVLNEALTQSQASQSFQVQVYEQASGAETPQFDQVQNFEQVYEANPAPVIRPDGSYQELPRPNYTPQFTLSENYRTEFNAVSQPTVDVRTVETVETYPVEQVVSYSNAPLATSQDNLGSELYREQISTNYGQESYSQSEIVNRRHAQSSRMTRSPRPDQELQEIQSRINRSDIITHPKIERPAGMFDNVEHYQA